MKKTAATKAATAYRKAGDVYDVFYRDGNDCDFGVPGRYLDGLRRKGYTITLDRRNYRGEGEAATEVLPPITD